MKAVVNVDIIDGKCVVIYSDGSTQELYEYLSDEGGGSGESGLTAELKSALDQLAQKVAYIDAYGQTYYDALHNALYPATNLLSISCIYTQSGTVTDRTPLNNLRTDLVVTAHFSDGTTQTVIAYTLSGTLEVGTSTITVSYSGKTTAFNVTVSSTSILPSAYQQVEYIQTTGTQHIVTDYVLSNTLRDLPYTTFNIDGVCDSWQSNYSTNILACFGSGGGAWIGYNNTKEQIAMGTSEGMFYSDDAFVRHSYAYSCTGSTGKFTRDDGEIITRSLTGTNNVPFELFYYVVPSGTQNDFHFNGKLYSCDVSYNSVKVLDLYPCYRKSDGEIGLYDIVNDTFYTNDGTGTFGKGSDV